MCAKSDARVKGKQLTTSVRVTLDHATPVTLRELKATKTKKPKWIRQWRVAARP